MKSELEDGDVEKIAEKILGSLKPFLVKTTRDHKADDIMDVKGLCAYLKVTQKWVYEQTHLKAIPHYKLTGKVLRFKRSDIDKWIEGMKTPALSEPTGKVRLLT